MQQKFKAVVNGTMEFSLSEDDLSSLDALQTSSGTFHVLKEGRPFHVAVVENDFNSRTYTIKVGKESYEVVLKDDLDQLIAAMGFSSGSSKNISSILAPMPGLLLEIKVKEGDAVKEDDPLVILEAMKMENIITSPRDGIIKKIAVKTGDAVDKKQLLLSFE